MVWSKYLIKMVNMILIFSYCWSFLEWVNSYSNFKSFNKYYFEIFIIFYKDYKILMIDLKKIIFNIQLSFI